MRIRSPSKAPPVLRFDGSTDTIAILLSLVAIKKRRISSSTKDDLPAPPVPVIPNTGVLLIAAILRILVRSLLFSSGAFSAAEIKRAMACFLSCSGTPFFKLATSSFLTFTPVLKSQRSNMSSIMPSKPRARPSSGE